MFKHGQKGATVLAVAILRDAYSRQGEQMPPDVCVFEWEILPSGEVTAKITFRLPGKICVAFGRLGESGKRFSSVREAMMELRAQFLNSGVPEYLLAKGVASPSASDTGSSENIPLDNTMDSTQSAPSEGTVSPISPSVGAPVADPTPRGTKRLRSDDNEGPTSTHNTTEMRGSSYREILEAYCSESGRPWPAITHQPFMVEDGPVASLKYHTFALMGPTPVRLPVAYRNANLAEEKLCKLILKNFGITPKRG